MKAKTLRKKDSKEFVQIHNIGSTEMVFTAELPILLPNSVTFEDIKEFYSRSPEILVDELELIELDLIEADTVGADIRNKLSPIKNLCKMMENTNLGESPYIQKGIEQVNNSIEYLSNLL